MFVCQFIYILFICFWMHWISLFIHIMKWVKCSWSKLGKWGQINLSSCLQGWCSGTVTRVTPTFWHITWWLREACHVQINPQINAILFQLNPLMWNHIYSLWMQWIMRLPGLELVLLLLAFSLWRFNKETTNIHTHTHTPQHTKDYIF